MLRAIRRKGYRLPTPIQRKTLPLILQARLSVAIVSGPLVSGLGRHGWLQPCSAQHAAAHLQVRLVGGLLSRTPTGAAGAGGRQQGACLLACLHALLGPVPLLLLSF